LEVVALLARLAPGAMGAALSGSEPNRLAIAAISHVVHLGRADILRLEGGADKTVRRGARP
jgi:hypothetical protein